MDVIVQQQGSSDDRYDNVVAWAERVGSRRLNESQQGKKEIATMMALVVAAAAVVICLVVQAVDDRQCDESRRWTMMTSSKSKR